MKLIGIALLALVPSCSHATDYYAAYGAPVSGTCTDPASPCELSFAMSAASGPDIRIHIAASTSTYTPQDVGDSGKSMTLIGAGMGSTIIGSAGSTCAINVTTATIVLEDLSVGGGYGAGHRGVCVNVPNGATASLSLQRVDIDTVSGSRGIDVVTAGSGSAQVSVLESIIERNDDGGIVFAGTGSVSIDRSLISSNSNNNVSVGGTLPEPAPVDLSGSVSATITNSTFANNNRNAASVVGGISNTSNALVQLENATFSDYYGFEISARGADIEHSIVAGTCSIGFAPGGNYSVESPGNTCGLGANSLTNVSATALNLAALASNGGPTQTMTPQSPSVAIGLGGTGCQLVDQRDFVRMSSCDAGAVQSNATLPDVIFADGFE